MTIRAIISLINASTSQLQWMKTELASLNINVVGGIGHRSLEERFRIEYPESAFHPISMFNTPLEWKQPVTDIPLHGLDAVDIEAALPMTERYPPHGGGSMEAITRLIYEFSIANNILDEAYPDVILFVKEPEAPLEFAVYKLAQRYGIPTILTRASLGPSTRLAGMNFEDPVLDENGEKSGSAINLGSHRTQDAEFRGQSPTYELIKEIQNSSGSFEHSYMKRQKFRFKKSDLILDAIREQSLYELLNGGLMPSYGPLLKLRLLSAHNRLTTDEVSVQRIIEQNAPTIYFPLHYQPEQTTMPLGGSMVNQIKAIKILSDEAPDNAQILVKEHPSVFTQGFRVTNAFRSKSFYQWLTRIPKVKLLPLRGKSLEYVKQCSVTATIRGTASWEAVALGKPGIVFGYTSFGKMPGIVDASTDTGAVLRSFFEGQWHNTPDLPAVKNFCHSIDNISMHNFETPSLDESTICDPTLRFASMVRAADEWVRKRQS